MDYGVYVFAAYAVSLFSLAGLGLYIFVVWRRARARVQQSETNC